MGKSTKDTLAGKSIEKILAHDIIIPAGTVFKSAPTKTERYGSHAECLVSLSRDSVAFFTLSLDDAPEGTFE